MGSEEINDTGDQTIRKSAVDLLTGGKKFVDYALRFLLLGGTDKTPIGNTGDRLKVDTYNDNLEIISFFSFPINGGSSSLNVDGSSSDIDFVIGPPSGQVWKTRSIGIAIQDMGTANHDEFGNGPALTTGLKILFKINTVEHLIGNILTNLGIAFLFKATVLGGMRQFLDDDNLFAGERVLVGTLLNGDAGDKVIYRVRDDLSSIDFLTGVCEFERIL